ncbi:Alginate lyase precursor [Leclercia adecarboxylata]|uniref:Alginate lyase n=1 Tax=Leclercia adecarboxylata TaxID=83655 RepID=A0A4U9HUH8_9ENTR|nr:Alginate lyase precursor [Leclercia adecarboxylata]
MIASFAAANKVDVTQENHGALARLVNYVLQQKDADLEWLEPWCALSHCSSVTLSRLDTSRPLQDRRLGGNLNPTLSALNLRIPPSTNSSAALIKLAASEARNATTFATSSASPMRPSGQSRLTHQTTPGADLPAPALPDQGF